MKEQKKVYSEELGIDLSSGREEEIFKWFLACLLFGKPIQQGVAKRTFFEFIKNDLTSPGKILQAGWEALVKILDKGHYVRYDFSTADKLLEIMDILLVNYGGEVSKILEISQNPAALRLRLEEFRGVGRKTAQIFLRDILRYGLLKTKTRA